MVQKRALSMVQKRVVSMVQLFDFQQIVFGKGVSRWYNEIFKKHFLCIWVLQQFYNNEKDEYEEEIITEKLPSLNRQAKENAKIHNRIQRDEDQEQLKRMEEAFMGDEIQRAKGSV